MKRTAYFGLLIAEAAACVAFCILRTSLVGVFTTAMAFPFEQIGMALRFLSLSSQAGNMAAIIAYIAVSLLPVAVLVILRGKRKLHTEDALLVLLSAALFVVLYMMINPGIIGMLTGRAAGQIVGKAVLGCIVYSVLCGYIILIALRMFAGSGTKNLLRYMSIMLGLLNMLFVYLAFGACFSEMLDSIAALKAGNVGNEHLLDTTYIFLVLQFLVSALPYALDALIVFAAMRLLDSMQADRYSDETVSAAGRMSRLCAAALVATVLANIGFNLLQLAFAKSLMELHSSVQIPVFSIAFVLAALLLTRFITENKQLKDDNDLFI